MASANYDSVLISIDWISFRYFLRREFRAYLLVVTADTNGTIGIYESPELYSILHRPFRDKPATIDFGFDGFVIYSSAGAVPDLVRFDVFVVRDRSKDGRAGAVRTKLHESPDLLARVDSARAAMASASSDGAMAAEVATAVRPVLEMVGGLVEDLDHEVIEAYSGSKIFDGAIVAKEEGDERKQIHQAVVSPTGNIETKVDITLFQRLEGEGVPNHVEVHEITREPPDREPHDPKPPETTNTTKKEQVALDPAALEIALHRPRVMYRIGLITAALVPASVALAALTSDSDSEISAVFFLFAAVAMIISPGLLFGAGQWARARSHQKRMTPLGWVALVFHWICLACIALGVVFFFVTLTTEIVQQPSFQDALGELLKILIKAFAILIVTIMIAPFPWLVSVITGAIFGRRATRKRRGSEAAVPAEA